MGCGCNQKRSAAATLASRAARERAPLPAPPVSASSGFVYVVRCADGPQVFSDAAAANVAAGEFGCDPPVAQFAS